MTNIENELYCNFNEFLNLLFKGAYMSALFYTKRESLQQNGHLYNTTLDLKQRRHVYLFFGYNSMRRNSTATK